VDEEERIGTPDSKTLHSILQALRGVQGSDINWCDCRTCQMLRMWERDTVERRAEVDQETRERQEEIDNQKQIMGDD
jgi:hypothetical protein